MSVEKVFGGFTGYDLECNGCGKTEYIDADWDDPFSKVIAAIKDLCWVARKEGGEWRHYCPDCQKQKRREE